MHDLLVAGQIALTLLLLTSAAAAINGFVRLVRTNLGYDPHNIMSVGIPVHQNTHVSWEDRSTYFEQLLGRVAAMPEVVSAGISTNATPPSNGWDQSFEIFGTPTAASEQLARISSVRNTFRFCAYRSCRGACGTMRKSCAARGWR